MKSPKRLKNIYWLVLLVTLNLILFFQNCDRSDRPLSNNSSQPVGVMTEQTAEASKFLDNTDEPEFPGLNFYGYRFIAEVNDYRAGYWQNGVFHVLPMPAESSIVYLLAAKKMAFSNSVLGYYKSGSQYRPIAWQNHKLQYLQTPDLQISRFLNGALADFNGQIFYSASYETTENTACRRSGNYWQNLDAQNVLDDSSRISTLTSIDADQTGVYFAGLSSDCNPGIWVNNDFQNLTKPTDLTDTVPSEISVTTKTDPANSAVTTDSMIVTGKGIHRSGGTRVGYWINNVWTELKPVLTTGETLMNVDDNDLLVLKSDIYVLGTFSTNLKTHYGFWKNQVWNELTINANGIRPAKLGKISVVNGKTIVTGYFTDGSNYFPGLWINGQYKSLTDPQYKIFGIVLFTSY
jgi:hypothetical protein